ncbi:hypothetical protein B005_4584 [Nocardiopsis alba ATCC BAA-2165]|uniref:Uncharacterized protein n=1 Tax=Nocardiopsis alba (strain ATCC BAA-2165 / BE74) TaxID=1205910 RepID=J7LHB3_NOCAA|nr:hypothetical protein B005_4584 [Nocardiopsis alba ATCC BAA-2165]
MHGGAVRSGGLRAAQPVATVALPAAMGSTGSSAARTPAPASGRERARWSSPVRGASVSYGP